MRQPQRRDRPAHEPGGSQHLSLAGHGNTCNTQGGPQALPGYLPRPSHQHHDELPLSQPEDDAADDLRWRLSTLAGGFIERFRRMGMLEEPVGDTELVKRPGGWNGI